MSILIPNSLSNNGINKSSSEKNNINNILIKYSSICLNSNNYNNLYIYKKQNYNLQKIKSPHIHKISLSSPFCITCGSIYQIENSSSKIFSSIKPNNLFYKTEISILKIISNLRNQCDIEKNNFIINSNFKLTQNLISTRKKIVNKIKDYIKKLKYSNSCFFLSVYLLDYIILNERINLNHKLEQLGIGCLILSIKFIENINYISNLKHLQYLYEGASSFSREQLRRFEVNCLFKLNYHIQKISFYEIVHYFLINGIVFNTDLNLCYNKKINLNIYFLIIQICNIIIENNINYIQFNQFELACAVISFARKISKYNIYWPEILMELYKIHFEEFEEQFNFVELLYLNKTQLVNSNTNRNISYNHSSGKTKLKIKLGNSLKKKNYNSNNKDIKDNNNKYKCNQKLFQNYKRLMSQSVDMARENNILHSSIIYSSNKKHNNSIVSNKNNSSNNYIKSNNTNRSNSNKGNSINKNQTSSKKKNKIYHSQSLDKKDISVNLSYRTITETCNLKKIKIDDYKTKIKFIKNNSNKIIKENNNVINKRQKLLYQDNHIIIHKNKQKRNENSNNINKKNNTIQKKDNNWSTSHKILRQNINLNLVAKNNNNNEVNENKKLKKKIDIIEELTMNKLRKLSKNDNEQKQKKKRKNVQTKHINNTNINNINYLSNNNNINNTNKGFFINKHGRNLSVFIPNKSTNSAFVY